MIEWLVARSLFGAPRWLVGLVLLAAIIAASILGLSHLRAQAERHDAAQRAAGAASQRAGDLASTLERTEQANAARTEISDPRSTARYDQCLRSSRPSAAANCQRFLPQRPQNTGGTGTGSGR